MLKIPHLPDGFTPEFMTQVLHHCGVLNANAQVADVERLQVGDGTGMMSELARLQVTYEGDDTANLPRSYIGKYASQNETNRGVALSYHLYERETRYFSELDPLTTARTPVAYYSGCDEDRFLILMEDLVEYEVGSQEVGATLEQTELAIDELAKLHSSFWGRVGDLDWIPNIADSYHADNMKMFTESGWATMLDKFADYLPETVDGLDARFLPAIVELQTRMNTAPLTLCHGDFRMENLMYGTRPEHAPVVTLDWQGPLRARGMNDVALFLGHSTKTEVRRAHERALLDRYLEGLTHGGVTGLNKADAWQDYRQAVLYNWIYVTVVAGTLDSSNATAYAWMAQMVARQAAIADDLGVYDLLP